MLKYVQGKDGVPKVSDTCSAHNDFFDKYSIDSLSVDTRTCASCLKCSCNYSRIGSQEKLESEYLKNHIKFVDGKFFCNYLYRSELSKLPLIDNSRSALLAAQRNSKQIAKLPMADQQAFNKNLEAAREMDALENWDKVMLRYPGLAKLPQRFVPGSHAYSGKEATTKLRPIWNSSSSTGQHDPLTF